ncbi:phosphoglycerate mutase family protein [Plectosphaerella cucumerina]|uniref:Phosphoglycerate mutase family protein n=1 Tax=Plectosphaerella cucumerina TaxID=40658 RepID=A0A8K0TIS5_9PEZI|nr:phosphoglycerate mutase family protein [Plectosphaerella cucumerina]
MPVTIHLVRHAQGYHNLSVENEQLPDPDLTELGNKQCAGVRSRFHSHDKLTHLVASPMRRTLHTCLQSFGPAPGDDDDFQRTALLPVLALPEIQEVSDNPCDTGSEVARLEEEFRGKVDFSRVPAGWNEKKAASSPWEPTLEKLEARARKARIALRKLAASSDKEDVHIAAVSHGAFLHFLTDDWSEINLPTKGTAWENCEFRSYQFVDPTGQDPNAHIRETQESWAARLKDKTFPTDEEQAELRRTYYREMGPFLKAENARH